MFGLYGQGAVKGIIWGRGQLIEANQDGQGPNYPIPAPALVPISNDLDNGRNDMGEMAVMVSGAMKGAIH